MCKCVSAKGYRRIRTVQIRSKGQDRISSIMNPRALRAVRSGLMAQIQSVEGVSLYQIYTVQRGSDDQGVFPNPQLATAAPPTPTAAERRRHRPGRADDPNLN
jgi:hypothetical protein